MGSSVGVKTHQIAIFRGNGAHLRSFFIGCAEREPKVFLGGMRFGAQLKLRTLLFLVGIADTLHACAIMEVDTI